jgi:hypothetical protein
MSIDEELKHAESSALLHSIQTSLWKADVWALRCLIEVEKTGGMHGTCEDLRKLATELRGLVEKVRHLRRGLDCA